MEEREEGLQQPLPSDSSFPFPFSLLSSSSLFFLGLFIYTYMYTTGSLSLSSFSLTHTQRGDMTLLPPPLLLLSTLTTKPIQRAALALERIHHIQSRDGLAASVLRVGHLLV